MKGSKIFSFTGILSGILSIISGIYTLTLSGGFRESSQSYGGDAYTGIQNAAAQTANNVLYLAEIVKFGLGAILIVFGIALICYFGKRIYDYKKMQLGQIVSANQDSTEFGTERDSTVE